MKRMLTAAIAVALSAGLLTACSESRTDRVSDRPGGTRVPVQRHADAARVDEIGFVRARSSELEVAVTEDDLPLLDACQESEVAFVGLGREALNVRERRAVTVEGIVTFLQRWQTH